VARVSIRDVALRAGVSVGTVSNVLNRPDEVSDDSLARVNAAVESLGYVRNDAARKLRNGISSTVGFVVLDGQNPFFNDVVRGAEDEASRHQIAVLYGNTDEDPSRERQYLDLFEEQQVRGVLIAPYGDISQRLEKLRGRGVPVVLVDRFSGDGRYSSVSVDSVAGGRMAAEHLIATGRRRLAFVGGPFEIRQVTDRLAGARVAVENSGIAVDLEVVATTALTVAQGVAAGMRILDRPRRDRPDALFAANDLVALGLLQALAVDGRMLVPDEMALIGFDDISFAATDLVALGLLQALAVDGRMLVPDEMALIGFDDISFAAAAAVPLSSMRQPSSVIGRTALRVLLEEAADPELIPRQTVFLPELVVRASTRARR